MDTWTVSCGKCRHSWPLAGAWTVYETAAIESRPCPCCGSYTLRSPEPRPVLRRKAAPRLALTAGRFVRRAV